VSQLRLCRDLANLGWNLCRIIFNLQSIADKMSNTPESNGTLSYTKGSSSKQDMSLSPDLGSEISSEKQVPIKKEEDSSDEKDEVDAKTPYEKKSIPAKNEEHRRQKKFTPILEVFGNHPSSQNLLDTRKTLQTNTRTQMLLTIQKHREQIFLPTVVTMILKRL